MSKPSASHGSASVVNLLSRFPARFGHLRDAPHDRLGGRFPGKDAPLPPPHESGGGDAFGFAGFREIDPGRGGRLFHLGEVRRKHGPTMMQDCTIVNAEMQRAAVVHCCKTASMDARTEYRAWMKAVMDAKGWSARQWALKAGVAPSTITRLFSDDSAPLPTYATLMKLAAHAPADLPVPIPSATESLEEAPDDIQMLKQLPPEKRKLVADLIQALSAPPSVADTPTGGAGHSARSPRRAAKR